jgi:O-antigen/teichoic acid export membrane protein
MLTFLDRQGFLGHVVRLASATLVAQLITIFSQPILTRLYSPADFGVLAIITSIVSMMMPVMCGRYDLAIVVAQDQVDREKFFHIATIFSALFGAAALLAVFACKSLGLFASTFEPIGGWAWLVPVFLLASGLGMALQAWENARQNYRVLGRFAIYQASIAALSSILLGLLVARIEDFGLILSYLLGLLAATTYLKGAGGAPKFAAAHRSAREIFRLAWRNRQYPIINGTTTLMNGFMSSMPVFFIAAYYSNEVLGLYSVLIRAAVSPLSFISSSVSQVNFKKVSVLISSRQDVLPYLLKLTLFLAVVASVPSTLLYLFSSEIFAVIFGAEWRTAGDYLKILLPSIVLQFIVSTLSLTYVAAGHLKLLAAWQVLAMITSFMVFSVLGSGKSIQDFLLLMCLKDLSIYLLYYAGIIYSASKPKAAIS